MFEECMKQMVRQILVEMYDKSIKDAVMAVLRSDEGMEWLREHTNSVIEKSLMEMNIPEMVDESLCTQLDGMVPALVQEEFEKSDFMDEEAVGRMIDSALGYLSVELIRR